MVFKDKYKKKEKYEKRIKGKTMLELRVTSFFIARNACVIKINQIAR